MVPSEATLPLAKVFNRLPAKIRRVYRALNAKWVTRGVGSPPVKLEAVKLSGRWFTSKAAVDRFAVGLAKRIAGSAAAGRLQVFDEENLFADAYEPWPR